MTPSKAEENRKRLRQLAKKANQRLVRLEREKAKNKKNFLGTALNYAHRALAQVGRKRFEENTKTMTDKEVSAALRRVSRFLNMPESTVAGQRAALEAYRKYQDYKEAKGAAAGPGVLGAGKKPAPVPETPMEQRRKESDDTGFERYKQLVHRALQGAISKTFSYRTVAQSIETGVKAGFSDEQILAKIEALEERDDVTRNELMNAFGPEAQAAAEEEEARGMMSESELIKWKRRKKTGDVQKKKRSAPAKQK